MWMHSLATSLASVAGLAAAAVCLSAAERALGMPRIGGDEFAAAAGPRPNPPRGFIAALRRMTTGMIAERRVPASPAARVGAFVLLAAELTAFAAVPFGPELVAGGNAAALRPVIVPGLEAGLLWALAAWGLANVAALAASESPAEMLSAARRGATAAALVAAVLGVVATGGTLAIEGLVEAQARSGVWGLFDHPLGFVAFALCSHSLCTRHGMNAADRPAFAAVRRAFPSAFAVAFTMQRLLAAYLVVELFLGGWHLWGPPPGGGAAAATDWGGWALRIGILHAKALAVMWAWARWGARVRLREGAWRAAISLGLVDFAVALVPFEGLFENAAWLARGAIGWSAVAGIVGMRKQAAR
ncbi:MAG: NADH-quinone oxidoreductase subunit H [Planctomycetales bacterium]